MSTGTADGEHNIKICFYFYFNFRFPSGVFHITIGVSCNLWIPHVHLYFIGILLFQSKRLSISFLQIAIRLPHAILKKSEFFILLWYAAIYILPSCSLKTGLQKAFYLPCKRVACGIRSLHPKMTVIRLGELI